MTAIRVVIADDQAAIRDGLAGLLGLEDDIEVVATAADGAQAVEAVAARGDIDVVLMDLRMPELDGVGATRQLTDAHPDVAVVVLTTYADEESIMAALGAGARGYLTKDSGGADIARAVRAAASGQAVLDRAVQDRLVAAVASGAGPRDEAAPSVPSLPSELTARETEVLTLIGEGLSNRAIAQKLFVSEATVKTHINNLFAKTQVRDRAEAVRLAFTHGLVS